MSVKTAIHWIERSQHAPGLLGGQRHLRRSRGDYPQWELTKSLDDIVADVA